MVAERKIDSEGGLISFGSFV